MRYISYISKTVRKINKIALNSVIDPNKMSQTGKFG